jgi:hypothetical protein
MKRIGVLAVMNTGNTASDKVRLFTGRMRMSLFFFPIFPLKSTIGEFPAEFVPFGTREHHSRSHLSYLWHRPFRPNRDRRIAPTACLPTLVGK